MQDRTACRLEELVKEAKSMLSGASGCYPDADRRALTDMSFYSHACLQFAATEEEQKTLRTENRVINLNAGNYSLDRGWLDVPRRSKVTGAVIGDETDRITCFT